LLVEIAPNTQEVAVAVVGISSSAKIDPLDQIMRGDGSPIAEGCVGQME
jgi:hypothetical protein